jgi:hypothetical protein
VSSFSRRFHGEEGDEKNLNRVEDKVACTFIYNNCEGLVVHEILLMTGQMKTKDNLLLINN